MKLVGIKNVILFGVSVFVIMLIGQADLHAANGSVTFTYDALGRISTVTYDTGVFVFYTYDANGNRLNQTANVNTATLTWCLTGGSCGSNTKWGQALW